MIYKNIEKGIFLERPNRFIAKVLVSGKEETVHVKNTGRCKELLVPDASVILSLSDNEKRKTKYDLVSVYKEGFGLINMDSQAPNVVVKEWLSKQDVDFFKPEYGYGDSRIDFYIEKGNRKILMEVKGCTLEKNHVGYFPDAPTERGAKHLRELQKAVKEGYESYLAYVIQMENVEKVLPNGKTDPQFEKALREAKENGVQVLFLQCKIKENQVDIIKVRKE